MKRDADITPGETPGSGAARPDPALPPRYSVLSAAISATNPGQAVDLILGWVARRERHYVNVCTSDIALKCRDIPELADAVNHAALATPDGMPLVWLGRLRGFAVERVYGPDLMLAVCRAGVARGCTHYFYGSTPEVLRDLGDRLQRQIPGLRIAGSHSPPFRPLTVAEEEEDAARIDAARPDIVWCGLGTLKQDLWVARFRDKVEAPVLISVGAAFAFHAGRLRQAPRWMMRCGLEWFFRLCMEPRRLWRRYLLGNPRFVALAAWQLMTGRPRPVPCAAGAAPAAATVPPPGERVNILGVHVSVTDPAAAAERICAAAAEGRRGYVCVTSVHGIVESLHDGELRDIHNRSLLTVPDGMPTVWFGQEYGHASMGRVYGPDLMRAILRKTSAGSGGVSGGRRHFLCGSTEAVRVRLVEKIRKDYPDAVLAGGFSPPFRGMSPEELDDLAGRIRAADADLVWIGLSTPKQERLMAALAPRLGKGILIGVGAAFDILAGLRPDAPGWMQRNGLHWFYRLCQEPQRLGPRYARIVPAFLFHAMLQLLGIRRYGTGGGAAEGGAAAP